MHIFFGLIFAILLWAGSSSPAFAKDQVWFETPVAEISVGYDSATRQTRQRAYYLAYVGPIEAIPNPSAARACAEKTVQPVRDRLRNDLALSEYRRGTQNFAQWQAKDLQDTERALLAATLSDPGSFFRCMRDRGAPEVSSKGFYLSLVQRDCTPAFCPLSKTRTRLAGDPDIAKFEAIYRWIAAKSPPEQRSTVDTHFKLSFANGQDNSVYLASELYTIAEVNRWPPRRTEAQRAKDLGRLVTCVRENKVCGAKISYAAPLVADVSRAAYVKIADAVGAPELGYAISRLQGGDLLQGIPNEIARIRLNDCRYFRGLTDLAAAAKCAGYDLNATATVTCLSGGACDPSFNEAITGAAILTGAPTSLGQLASASVMPRYLPGNLGRLKTIYDGCATNADRNGCVAAKLLDSNADFAKARACWNKADATAKVSCSIESMGGDAGYIQCARAASSSSAASCVLARNMSPQNQRVLDCAGKGNVQLVSTCLSGLLGGEAGRLVACRQQSGTDMMALALCTASNRFDARTQKVIACVRTTTGMAGFATCAAASQLPPQLAMQLGCVTQGGGPLGTGVCLATASMDLTPEQRIMLQCLASSGGVPAAFAACAGGQLTMKELAQCKGKNFGEENCFGENNEFQRLAKAITGKSISSNSVVGQMINVQLQPAVVAFAAAEPVINAVTGSASKQVDQVLTNLKNVTEGDPGAIAGAAIATVAAPTKIATDVGAAVISIVSGIKF